MLSDFRDRLAEDGRADRLLDLALERLREAGRVKDRGRQRTDSTHVLAAVRDLTRLELVTEAMRAALEELASTARRSSPGSSPRTGASATAVPCVWARTRTHPKIRINTTGADVHLLLTHLHERPVPFHAGPQVKTLRQVFLQNYRVGDRGRLR